MEEFAVFHSVGRVAVDESCFTLPLDDGDRFVHLSDEALLFLAVAVGHKFHLRCVDFYRVVFVDFHCKRSEREEVDAVAFFEGDEVGVA